MLAIFRRGALVSWLPQVLCGMYCLGHKGQLSPDVLDHTTNRLYDATGEQKY